MFQAVIVHSKSDDKKSIDFNSPEYKQFYKDISKVVKKINGLKLLRKKLTYGKTKRKETSRETKRMDDFGYYR